MRILVIEFIVQNTIIHMFYNIVYKHIQCLNILSTQTNNREKQHNNHRKQTFNHKKETKRHTTNTEYDNRMTVFSHTKKRQRHHINIYILTTLSQTSDRTYTTSQQLSYPLTTKHTHPASSKKLPSRRPPDGVQTMAWRNRPTLSSFKLIAEIFLYSARIHFLCSMF